MTINKMERNALIAEVESVDNSCSKGMPLVFVTKTNMILRANSKDIVELNLSRLRREIRGPAKSEV